MACFSLQNSQEYSLKKYKYYERRINNVNYFKIYHFTLLLFEMKKN